MSTKTWSEDGLLSIQTDDTALKRALHWTLYDSAYHQTLHKEHVIFRIDEAKAPSLLKIVEEFMGPINAL